MVRSIDDYLSDPESLVELDQNLISMIRSYDKAPDPFDLTISLEVEARAFVYSNRLEAGHKALTLAKKGAQPDHPGHQINMDVTLAMLYLFDNQNDQAHRVLSRAKEASDHFGLLHQSARTSFLLSHVEGRSL